MWSPTEIEQSARDIANRVARGAPPGNWSEAEAVLAALLLFYADPSRLGGTKVSKAGRKTQHPAIVAIARAIGRTENAVSLKVQNMRSKLTGGGRGMSHGGKIDEQVVERYAHHLDELVTAGVLVAKRIPDVEDAIDSLVREADSPDPLYAGPRERLSTEVSTSVEPTTSAMANVVVRRGQGLFRSRVMANYSHGCAFCGLRARRPASNSFFLFAGHILPWSDASDHQRLDPRNGLALCAIHDRAFEWGFIGLDEDLRLVVSPAVRAHYEPEALVQAEFGALHGRPLWQEAPAFEPPGDAYLLHHREQVFDRRFQRARVEERERARR